jgi:hypothetical protein
VLSLQALHIKMSKAAVSHDWVALGSEGNTVAVTRWGTRGFLGEALVGGAEGRGRCWMASAHPFMWAPRSVQYQHQSEK